MTLPTSFKEEYAETARLFLHFVGHDQMERFHPTHWRLKLDKALGMPWTLYRFTHSVSIRFSFSGAALNLQPEGLRFAPAVPARSSYDARMFDNFARFDAARCCGFAHMQAHQLRGYMDGRLPIKRTPGFVPAMSLDIDFDAPPPTPEERVQHEEQRKLKWAEHVAKHEARMAERDKEDAAIIAHVNRHDPAQVTGAQAFYTDMRLYLEELLKDTRLSPEIHPYNEWLLRYIDQKMTGKADKDILPLRLDRDFPELGPAPRRSGPAP